MSDDIEEQGLEILDSDTLLVLREDGTILWSLAQNEDGEDLSSNGVIVIALAARLAGDVEWGLELIESFQEQVKDSVSLPGRVTH